MDEKIVIDALMQAIQDIMDTAEGAKGCHDDVMYGALAEIEEQAEKALDGVRKQLEASKCD